MIKIGWLKNMFTNKTATSSGDPFVDHLVSLSSDDPNVFVGASVLRNTDVFAAISIIASDIATNPIKSDSKLYNKMLNEHPNDLMDARSFKFALAACMLLNGNSFAKIDLSTHSLIFIPNNEMTLQEENNKLIYTYSPDGKTKQVIPPSQILHFKCFTRDGLVGISPLYALRDVVDAQDAGNDLMESFLGNGVHGTTLVQVHEADLNPEAKENIRKQFDDATTGTKALKTIVTDDGMDVKTLPLNTDVLKLVQDMGNLTTRQVAEAFRIPVFKLGVEEEHSNQEQSNLQYVQGTLASYESCFTSELNYKLNQTFTFDNSALMSLDPAAQQQMAINGYTNGIYTRNEARAMLNLDPVTDGNNFVQKEGIDSNGKATND